MIFKTDAPDPALTAARHQRDELEVRLLRTDARVNHLNTVVTDTERERDRYRDALAAKETQLATTVEQRNHNAFRAAVHADTLMQVLTLVSKSSDAATRDAVRAAIVAGRDAVTGRRPAVPDRPPAPPILDATAVVVVAPMRFHVGRHRTDHRPEQKCPCPLMPCGLVLDVDVEPACPYHGRRSDPPALPLHPADHCPAVLAPAGDR